MQVFDKGGCGYIIVFDLRVVLQCMGEDFIEEESKKSILKIRIFFNFLCIYNMYQIFIWCCLNCYFIIIVDEMIVEVDIDGDGRIDFEGKVKCICKLYIFVLYV